MKFTTITLAAMLLAACGETSTTVESSTVGFALTADTTSDDSGASHEFADVRFNVRHIEFDLPPGVTCAEIADALEGARCEAEDGLDDNGVDTTPDDNGVDTTPDDNGVDTTPDDNGLDDNGSDDNGADDNSNRVLGKIVIDGPFVVDLKAGTTSPALDSVKIPDLAYSRVDIRIDDDEAGLLDGMNSWLMTTQTVVDGESVAVDMALKFNEDIRFEAPGGVRVAGGPIMVSFDTSAWFEGVDFTSCIANGDIQVSNGVAYISDDSDLGRCDDIESTLKTNLKRSGQLR